MENRKIADDYIILKGNGEDAELENYRECFEKNGMKKDFKNLQWLHQRNLANTNIIYYAMKREAVAAIYTAIPLIFSIDGKKKIALQSIDTITDEAHRGKGLFPKLASRLFGDAEKNEFELVYGFPNENSAPGFFKKLQWASFGEAPFLIKPLGLLYFIKKFFKNQKEASASGDENVDYSIPPKTELQKNIFIKQLHSFEEDYDLIWKKAVKKIGVCVDRSAAYMNWRYVEKPGEQYAKCGIYIDDQLKGVIVFTIKNKHDGRIGYIMELIYEEAFAEVGVMLLKYATKVFKTENVDTALAWCFPHSFNYKSFTQSGYFNLPIKFRPQHLFLGVRALNDQEKNFIENYTNWYISYSDSDTV